ncbi:hypothetical protein [Trinickia terrae]|nr:hypothetical protein [Trinickia terrae]
MGPFGIAAGFMRINNATEGDGNNSTPSSGRSQFAAGAGIIHKF